MARHRWIGRIVTFLTVLALAAQAHAEGIWITHPEAQRADAAKAPVALQFRRAITSPGTSAPLFVHVSADNRFVLFVNGTRVAAGPARGDLTHWRYARIDLAPYLRRGANMLTATVWSDGELASGAQIYARTGFLLAAEDAGMAALLDSGAAWQVRVDRSRTVTPAVPQIRAAFDESFYYAAGAPETLSATGMLADWPASGASATDWQAATPAVAADAPVPWTLVPDALPQMRHAELPGGRLVRSEGVDARAFPGGAVTIPAHTTARLLVDAGRVQAAYPRLMVDGGAGARITLAYSEGLYKDRKDRLADRAQVEGGLALGLADTFLPDGGKRTFQPYWWRAWRFAEIAVTTGDAPLRLERFDRFETGYPFDTKGWFRSDDPALDRIWAIGWNTVKLDAHETFMDTAYWEQLQYAGDTRLEALVSYAVSGDPRLGIQAIDAFASKRVNGLPPSRYPSREDQSIPPFALLWIGMVHDFWMNRPERDVVTRSLPTAQEVMRWYDRYVGNDGLVGTVPGWQFIDWIPTLSNGPEPTVPPTDPDSCIMTLLYVGAAQQLAAMERAGGAADMASSHTAAAVRASEAVRRRCWSAQRQLFADSPGGDTFSQHANILAVLYDVAPSDQHAAILDRIWTGSGITPRPGIGGTTYYFSYYLARAIEHAGLSDRYPALMQTWRTLLAQNFTTWPENPDPSRSDTHAWSAHPTADLLGVVAGIRSASPGFASVEVAPHLGALRRLDAALAHPDGLIRTRYDRAGDRLRVTIDLPAGLSGTFRYGGRSEALRPGRNSFTAAALP
jgi:hypothetical protein